VKTFVEVNGRVREVELVERLGELVVTLDGRPIEVSYEEVDPFGQVILLHGGEGFALSIEGNGQSTAVTLAGHRYDCTLEDERERAANLAARAAAKGGGPVKAVMPGVVLQLLVAPGDEVEEGQPLLILEAMKMQNEIAAPAAGKVKKLTAQPGMAVEARQPLCVITPQA
jgi:biotin carboxyl carrier protein